MRQIIIINTNNLIGSDTDSDSSNSFHWKIVILLNRANININILRSTEEDDCEQGVLLMGYLLFC